MPTVQLGDWRTLPAPGGSALAFADRRLAVAGQSRICILDNDTVVAAADAPWPAPGVPRFVGERVYWGAGFLDLDSGAYTALECARPAPMPRGGERPHVYAWSPRGDRFVASVGTSNSAAPARVTLHDGRSGDLLATLWNGTGLPPQAAWFGERAIVVGFRAPRVFAPAGKFIATLGFDSGSINCMTAANDERRLLVVDQNRYIAWMDTETWTVLDRWPGPWLHAAVSSDGTIAAALEPWGKLHFAMLKADRFQSAGMATVPDSAVAVALGSDEIATVGGGEVSRARVLRR